jgi:tetratricopeptide (TPR) repeat protein
MDANGSPVTDLSAEDFSISQGDVEVEVVGIELINQPLRLAIVVDNAGGGREYFRELRDGLPGFVDALPSDSQVKLILLSGRARTAVDYSDGLAKVRERLEEFFPDTNSAAGFFAGVRDTVSRFEDDRWPVIALITTDGPSMSSTSFTKGKYEELAEWIREGGVTVHALAMNTREGDGFQTAVARQLTLMTGGWYAYLNGPTQAVSERLTAMATEIAERQAASANQYLVMFESAPGATPNTLVSVGVRRQQTTLRISPDGRLQPSILSAASYDSLLAEADEAGDDAASGDGASGDGPSREVFWNAGEVAFASGDVNTAAGYYEQAHEADPTWGKPLFKLGLVSLNKGDIEAAVQYFEQVVEVDPRSSEADQAKAVISQLK